MKKNIKTGLICAGITLGANMLIFYFGRIVGHCDIAPELREQQEKIKELAEKNEYFIGRASAFYDALDKLDPTALEK